MTPDYTGWITLTVLALALIGAYWADTKGKK